MNPRQCYRCRKPGHIAAECQEAAGSFNKNSSARCYKCNQYGHISKDCKETNTESKCYNCDQFGHLAKECTNESNAYVIQEFKRRSPTIVLHVVVMVTFPRTVPRRQESASNAIKKGILPEIALPKPIDGVMLNNILFFHCFQYFRLPNITYLDSYQEFFIALYL